MSDADTLAASLRALTASLLTLRELTRPLLDAVDGYRAECAERGYSPTAAEAMAMDFHRVLIANAMSGGSKTA